MFAVLQGFGVVIIVIAVGYFLARGNVLGKDGSRPLALVVYNVATPALLIDQLLNTDPRVVLGPHFAIVAASAVIVGLLAFSAFRLRGWDTPSSMVGQLSASYANGGNLGIPLAVYLIGDGAVVVPVILFQVAFYAPVMLTLLDISTSEATDSGWRNNITVALKNPMLIAAVVGLVLALSGWEVPPLISEPIGILAGASVPLALMVFGMSLHGAQLRLTRGVALVAGFKNIVHPIIAVLLAHFLFGMDGQALYTAAFLGALPTAQNVYTYAVRFRTATDLARDTGVASTLLALPVLIVIGLVLGV
ncbi:AEC family transporter [Corynebacterium cystitidis]|uniref:AEC family transporter n=1 Tax=Corynebacterium cystitidis TaxID=35757 RepID=UPI00211EA2F9|nr:AEC family transporter [Corynebacterium cystitidis]